MKRFLTSILLILFLFSTTGICLAKQFKILRKVKREGRTEVWVQVLDDKGKILADNVVMPVRKKKIIDILKEVRDKDPTAVSPVEHKERMVSLKEVLKRLYKLGYLEKGQTLDDLLPVKKLCDNKIEEITK